MDCKEAIEALRLEGGIEITGNPRRVSEFFKGIDVAISAMQELKEYKEYGTPNGYKSALEAYDKCYSEKEIIDTELYKYQQIGSLEEVREAVEKQKAKKPNYEGDGYAPDGTFVYDEWECPNCGKKFEVDYDDYDYCPKCGQAIDWSE